MADGEGSPSKKQKTTPKAPDDFYNREFILGHCKDILRFYENRVLDKSGGYHQSFYIDGTQFNPDFKQLVSSARMVINFALCGKLLARQDLLDLARHGLDYIEKVHWQPETETYAYTLRNHKPEDLTQHSYAAAFVLAAYAACRTAGVVEDDAAIAKVFDLMEKRYWLAESGAYADTITVDGVLNDYRGQNSNMHICEAVIAAYDATKDKRYLDRAVTLAETFTQRQAKLADGFIWEHYTKNFEIDWEYNKDDPKNLYRPWGFQPGHHAEWAKNLCNICRNFEKPPEWMLEKAKDLFSRAYEKSWDDKHGGLIYGFGPDGKWCDDDKYFWVQSESIAAAAQLFQATGDTKFRDQYNALWLFGWQNFVDHEHGAWFGLKLTRDGTKYSNIKAEAGAKCDYHTLVAFLEALRGMKS